MNAPQIPDADALLQRNTIDPNICHGKPCIRGLRYPVETFLELLSAGMTIAEILADYEDLERADILAVCNYSAWHLSNSEGGGFYCGWGDGIKGCPSKASRMASKTLWEFLRAVEI
jgi:uncharacterized protein (DUF433 family)